MRRRPRGGRGRWVIGREGLDQNARAGRRIAVQLDLDPVPRHAGRPPSSARLMKTAHRREAPAERQREQAQSAVHLGQARAAVVVGRGAGPAAADQKTRHPVAVGAVERTAARCRRRRAAPAASGGRRRRGGSCPARSAAGAAATHRRPAGCLSASIMTAIGCGGSACGGRGRERGQRPHPGGEDGDPPAGAIGDVDEARGRDRDVDRLDQRVHGAAAAEDRLHAAVVGQRAPPRARAAGSAT